MCCYSLGCGDWLLQTGGCIIQVPASTCEFIRSEFIYKISLLLSDSCNKGNFHKQLHSKTKQWVFSFLPR